MIVKTTFGQWLKQRRKSLDLTREDLATRIGCAAVTLYKIESDERRPSKQIAELLAICLNIPSDERAAFVRFARAETSNAATPFGTPYHPPTNLPTQPMSLIGRDDDVIAIRQRMSHANVRLLTLLGPPGIGKTQLALQVAASVLADFPDGVFFVALAPITDANLVATTIANTLDVKESGPQSPLERLKVFLCDKQMLLVLDNVEQVLPAASQLAELLTACPFIKILVTSRAALRIRPERQLPVTALALPDLAHLPDLDTLSRYAAIVLFVERAQAVKPDFLLTSENAPTIAAICTRLDGLPLAIELISAQVKLLPPAMLLDRLNGHLLLQSEGMQDLEPRHRTLNVAIGWSYELLAAEEQMLFRWLGVFVNGCTLEAVEAVCMPPMSALAGLSSLLDKNLIGQITTPNHESRFVMLETIHAYALEQLIEHDELAHLQPICATYFLSLAEQAHTEFQRSDYRRWVSLIDAEEGNLRASLAYFKLHQVEQAVRLVEAIEPFWRNRGHAAELSEYVEKLMQANPALSAQHPALWANLLNLSAWLAYVLGNQALLSTRAKQALQVCHEIGDTTGILWALGSLSQNAALQGHDDEAEQYCLDGLARARQLENRWFICFYLKKLGIIVRNRGDHQRAFEYHREAALLVREVDDRAHKSRIFREAATSALFQQDYAYARAHFAEGLSLNCDPIEYAYSLEGFAGLAATQQQPERAARLLGAAEVQREIAHTPRVGLDRYFEHFVNSTRNQLDDATFANAWAAGRAMSLEQSVTYALET